MENDYSIEIMKVIFILPCLQFLIFKLQNPLIAILSNGLVPSFKKFLSFHSICDKKKKQAGAELCQAQVKLG